MAPVATGYSQAFVIGSLRPGARDLLEIGCGDGELAARLGESGFAVTALDSRDECVKAARERGVEAHLAEWPCALDHQFDAVLFTRSLHHIDELDEAIAAAERMLRPDGRLIVEDFRAEGGSVRSSDWFRSMVNELAEGGALIDDTDREAIVAKIEPPSDHEHELHGSAAIGRALEDRFAVSASDAAYYFRYLEPHLRQEGAASWLLEVELERIAAGAIDPLGLRFVADLR